MTEVAESSIAPTTKHWLGADILRRSVAANLAGENTGVYSVCCSHPLVIEAAVDQALADNSALLIEATANQVNQFGGYTGMQPADFASYVRDIAERRGLSADRVILGGDHLGPVCWTSEPAEAALANAETLLAAFAAAGFEKIHLDCSMPCADDPHDLGDAAIAERAARLCRAAETAAQATFGSSGIAYVIGTEVPPPGGADEELGEIEVTPPERAIETLRIHRAAFAAAQLDEPWRRVIALVVQPGVEFDHSIVVDYQPENAVALKQLAETATDGIAFEAHSTDYQRPAAFRELVRDHFAILKVGPALTFALREALFALSFIEDELVPAAQRSNLREVCEAQMLANPKNWQRFYDGDDEEQRLLRRYSLSDRIRYYWPDPKIEAACARLFQNLDGRTIPMGLLAQFLPGVLRSVRAGATEARPVELIKAHVRAAIQPYADAAEMRA